MGAGLLTFFTDDLQSLAWCGLGMLLLLRQAEAPCVDEVSPLGEERMRLLLPLALFVAVTLCPVPHGEADSFADQVFMTGFDALGL